MKLYIAEKPSLGRAIVDALPTPHHKADGCVYVGHSDKTKCDVVSWCIGHILEQAEPDVYDQKFKKWAFDTLPILPDEFEGGWKLTPKKQTRKQFTILKKLIKQATQIIHCGDPDREGQLLVDEVIHHVGVKANIKKTLQRCLISDLNKPAVQTSLANLKSNSDFIPLSVSALARSRADWLYGINMTRCCSLNGQKNGFKGVLSIGRVQTPILGLVVRRDIEIENFQAKPYFEVDAHIQLQTDDKICARWQPSKACSPYLDDEGRVLNQALAENVVKRIHGQPALLNKLDRIPKKQAPPLPYNLSALQIDAAKQFGFSAKAVLDACQALYERHKVITYPRSDNRYLPKGHFNQAKSVISAIANDKALTIFCEQANSTIKSKAWNDAKVAAHHAIIPTTKNPVLSKLSHIEAVVYNLIAKHYLAQFYEAWQFQDTKAEFEISGGLFVAKERITLDKGWKLLFEKAEKAKNSELEAKTSPSISNRAFISMKAGKSYLCEYGELLSKMTQAPKHFTDASLLAAMTGIARFVKDPDIKKILKDTDGLGTEATRAGIIELLFKRKFLERQGKQIRASKAGKTLVLALPEEMSEPDTTAHWELLLAKISNGQYRYDDFMLPLKQRLDHLLSKVEIMSPVFN
ncbi:MAG: DNA topoisomerase-3 [Oleiphilaceae bacterium]|jgi:DNA topoisomerase-3